MSFDRLRILSKVEELKASGRSKKCGEMALSLSKGLSAFNSIAIFVINEIDDCLFLHIETSIRILILVSFLEQFCCIFQIQFFLDVLPIGTNGLDAQAQGFSDLAGGVTFPCK